MWRGKRRIDMNMQRVCIAAAGVLLFAGCTSDGGSAAGTGAGTGSFSEECLTHADCGSGLVCVSSACQSAFPRTYVFGFRSATVAKYKSSGSSWDIAGGAPDPQARLQIDGKVVCSTSTVQDSFDPVWNEACEAEVFQTTEVILALWDMDGAAHDEIGGIDLGTPMLDSVIKAGRISGSTSHSLIDALRVDVSLK